MNIRAMHNNVLGKLLSMNLLALLFSSTLFANESYKLSPRLVYMADQNAARLFELFAVNLEELEDVSENGGFCFSLPTNDNKGLVYSCL